MRVRVETVGCRLNISEMEALARQLVLAGHRVVGPGEPVDLCVLNTCTVTSVAARKSRHFIRQLRRRHPGVPVVVTGCYAELEPHAATAAGAALVIGNKEKDDLPAALAAAGLLSDADPLPSSEYISLPPPGTNGRTRAFVKVQDGCDNRCTFCIVTVARGAGRSLHSDAVVGEIQRLAALGYREAVLSGVHLGSYGHDLGEQHGLAALVGRILRETGIPRLRLSSLEPWDLDTQFFDLFSDPRLLPHLHLPLQSGCDATLRRMARHTSRRDFAALVEHAHRAVPHLAVSTDVIVGFPGESDEEFAESIGFVEAMAFSRLHVFRYSPRHGTRAATMTGQVPTRVAQERSREMHALGARLEADCMRGWLGRTVEVLWEDYEDDGGAARWTGLTGNYFRVTAAAGRGIDLTNRVTPVTLRRLLPGAFEGDLTPSGLPSFSF